MVRHANCYVCNTSAYLYKESFLAHSLSVSPEWLAGAEVGHQQRLAVVLSGIVEQWVGRVTWVAVFLKHTVAKVSPLMRHHLA